MSLGIDNSIFSKLRDHFDSVLGRTLYGMRVKNCDSAEITIKLEIRLNKAEDLYKTTDGKVLREWVDKPTFFHTVTSTMKFKDKEEGFSDEPCGLHFNEQTGQFTLIPLSDQTQLRFEED